MYAKLILLVLFIFLILKMMLHKLPQQPPTPIVKKVKVLPADTLSPAAVIYWASLFGMEEHSHIIAAQSILETGWYSSRVSTEYNNILGLYDSSLQDYRQYNHWLESVAAYRRLVYNKYDSGCYYEFLEQLPYATDTLYITKIKSISW